MKKAKYMTNHRTKPKKIKADNFKAGGGKKFAHATFEKGSKRHS